MEITAHTSWNGANRIEKVAYIPTIHPHRKCIFHVPLFQRIPLYMTGTIKLRSMLFMLTAFRWIFQNYFFSDDYSKHNNIYEFNYMVQWKPNLFLFSSNVSRRFIGPQKMCLHFSNVALSAFFMTCFVFWPKHVPFFASFIVTFIIRSAHLNVRLSIFRTHLLGQPQNGDEWKKQLTEHINVFQ